MNGLRRSRRWKEWGRVSEIFKKSCEKIKAKEDRMQDVNMVEKERRERWKELVINGLSVN